MNHSSTNEKVLVIASAGGHLTQAMCATALCENIVLVSNKLNLTDDRVKKIYKIWDTQHNPLIHIVNIFFALYVLIRERPKAVFSSGGPIALPFALLCKFLPLRFVFVDTLSRVIELSNTGRLIKRYGLYNRFYCQWPEIAKANGAEFSGKCFDILGENTSDHGRVNTAGRPLILVTIGTNDYPFLRALKVISQSPLYRDDRVDWLIQAGDNTVELLPACGEVVAMVSRDQMESYVKRASLVVSHCGIGSINVMLRYQKRVVFIPRVERFGEFSDDHQLQIASELTNTRFDVINPGTDFPAITYEQLIEDGVLSEPVDITNYNFSHEIKSALFSQ